VIAFPRRFASRVVGVTFVEGYPDNLLRLSDAMEEHAASRAHAEEPLPAILRRNPENRHDANAIEVHVPSAQIGMIGHLPAPLAARLAPVLDSGERWSAGVEAELINRQHMDRPGITTITIERITDD
jgi:hypothetical protein